MQIRHKNKSVNGGLYQNRLYMVFYWTLKKKDISLLQPVLKIKEKDSLHLLKTVRYSLLLF